MPSYKTRKRLSLLVLVVGLPAYIVVAVSLVGWVERVWGRPAFWLELLIYVGLGVIWILPLKRVFVGVGQPDPGENEAGRPGGRPE